MKVLSLILTLFFLTQLGNAQCSFTQTPLISNVSCFGGNDGSISISVSGGIGPFQYIIDGGSILTVGVFSGLTAGTHNVQVIDVGDSFCSTSNNYIVGQPTVALSVSPV